MKIILLVALCFILTLLSNNNLIAQDGQLDPTFGVGGIVTTHLNPTFNLGNSITIQDDGKIVVAGRTRGIFGTDFAIIRLNSDGTLDESFGIGGKVSTDFSNGSDEAKSVKIQSDGKILVAGRKGFWDLPSSLRDFGIIRYNSDGTLDPTFGNGGKVTSNISRNMNYCNSIVLQVDGKMIASGSCVSATVERDLISVRYNQNGAVDTTFGSNGIATVHFQGGDAEGNSSILQNDHKLVVAGTLQSDSSYILLVRYLSDGSLDVSFGNGGIVLTQIQCNINSVDLQYDGKLVLAGTAGSDFLLVRYNADGTIDNSFGTNGIVTASISDGNDYGTSVDIRTDGKIVMTGYSLIGGSSDIAVARFNLDGTFDSTFGVAGKLTTPVGNFNDYANSIQVQYDGKIMVAGTSEAEDFNSEFVVVRYLSSLPITLDPSLIAYYPFNGDASDESGNSNHGILNNVTLTSDRFNNPNSAFYFDEDDDFIEIPNSATLQSPTNSITMTGWIRIDPFQYTGNRGIFTKNHEAGVGQYGLFVFFQQTYQAIGMILNNNTSTTQFPLSPGNWEFVCMTWDGALRKMFHNGELLSSGPFVNTLESDSSSLIIGSTSYWSSWLNACVDDIRIYNRALSESEVLSLYREGGWDLNWVNLITVSDINAESMSTLEFGKNSAATDSIDIILGEEELPPLPPAGTFDARFVLPINDIGSLNDFRNESKRFINWKLQFQGIPPFSFSWTPTTLPLGNFILKDAINGSLININMKEQSNYSLPIGMPLSQLIIEHSLLDCNTLSIGSGWNIVSIPHAATDSLKVNIFPTANSDAFWYNGAYISESKLSPRKGYWLNFIQDQSIEYCGVTVDDTIHIKSGWNMVGCLDEDVPRNQITTVPSGIITGNFFGYGGGYSTADTLKIGKGYWVRSNADGIIELNNILRKSDENIYTINQDWASIFISDALSKKMELYLTENEGVNGFDLPPMPPAGAFDVRFSSSKMVESLLNGDLQINISSANYPIRLKANGVDLLVTDVVNGQLLNTKVRNGSELLIVDPNLDRIKISGKLSEVVPTVYSLEQNYPNPFNPSTTIKFAVPEEVNVNLSIFNILGERVTTLKNENLKPGYYNVNFDASTYASGVYFYTFQAGEFISTKKMLLVK